MNGAQHNITREDLEAIANENWDEFETETDNLRKSPDTDKNKNKLQIAANAKEKKRISEANLTSWMESKKISSKGPKKFLFADDMDKQTNENTNINLDHRDEDFVPRSPESPRTKKARLIFKRSYDLTFHASMRNNVLLKDSDSE